MSNAPIQRLTVSDFRRIEGTREFPFDAPVVLIHGPNGTGKTSVLSALELALTGRVQSMERQSERYIAHLPFFGQAYATVRADVAASLQTSDTGVPLTVSGARIEGMPALSADAARFFSERCYLDQSSLGRLLDIYQTRSADGQSALTKFVNELLGLEKLDALLAGLSDANDLRNLKKLAAGAHEADQQAKAATAQLKDQSAILSEIRSDLAQARHATREAIESIQRGRTDGMTDSDLIGYVRSGLADEAARKDSARVATLHRELIELVGRISALVERPTTLRLVETRSALASAVADNTSWEQRDERKVRAWEVSAQTQGVNLQGGGDLILAVDHARAQVRLELSSASDVRHQAESTSAELETDRRGLTAVQTRLAEAHEQSSALIEGLSALRSVIGESNRCPVCDRDFAEADEEHTLLEHTDAKMAQLSAHSERLIALRGDRDQLAHRVAQSEGKLDRLTARILPPEQELALNQRSAALTRLAAEAEQVRAAKSNGADILRRVRSLEQTLENLEATSAAERHITSELRRYAALLQVDLPQTIDSFEQACAQLVARAESDLSNLERTTSQHRTAVAEAGRLAKGMEREQAAVTAVAALVEMKQHWDYLYAEAKRRQVVAKDVHEAATEARKTIVHRVFTSTLNDVWKSVFTRLAPHEGFIPSFGIPSATKKTFDIKLETTDPSGETSGPPQMMLSAGNLNTAALSLFLALHLAVEPIVPCLVFDDPVQAMDEVHVAQFAGLIRLLSKQNERQVVIAVHERELFDYLALELSPAYPGDELITIELGDRAFDEDKGINRHEWKPDPALAN